MEKLIVITNDDGIDSYGLFAAAEALSELGRVIIAAPREQSSGAGRSTPSGYDHSITPRTVHYNGKDFEGYAIGGTPAFAVQHAVIEICDRKPDLVVSGINYGENLGTSITASGTVGAAIEAASWGIPGLAMSLKLAKQEQFDSREALDFSACAAFTKKFAAMMLNSELPAGVDILNVNVPWGADENTPWRMTRLARHRYYKITGHKRANWSDPSTFVHSYEIGPGEVPEDTDIAALVYDGVVSVSPICIDLTANVDLKQLDRLLRKTEG